ncbi:hypothetical protein C5B89_09480 [Haloferax sp. Atlit-47N]|uniref:Uncharacterized protein n=2 Tax=Haloferax TaxID=2251 RepID=A0ACD5HYY7_9EURY|nr:MULTISPECIES: hypothetical protein [Haloferax]NLV03916.1 hypothetical protein [Haloferax alexandrinus]RDZ31372.1 hypothetical protein DEQ67_08230 [Haloferax sp. Atlit-48N]RDZ38779.1 hypothetical protein C5B89_09480 [Haloferax sp. Atlit-47N]
MVNSKALFIGVIAGAFVSGVYYLDGSWDSQLLLFLGVTWLMAGWLVARNQSVLKNVNTLPQILFALLVVCVPQFGVHSDLLLGSLRSPLELLVMGVAVAGIGLGAEMSESAAEEQSATVAPAD